MTQYRSNPEPDPMPAALSQIAETADLREPEGGKVAFPTGGDAGLSQSLIDLRNGYENAARLQSDESRQAAISRAKSQAQIRDNLPVPKVEFIGPRSEQYETGDSRRIASSDGAWSMPVEKLRETLSLAGELYGPALNDLLATGDPKSAETAIELEDRLRRSIGAPAESLPAIAPQQAQQARPETFPDGQLVHVSQNPDGTLSVELATGERFNGDPVTVARTIGEAHQHTKKWAQSQRAQTQQQPQPQNGNGAPPAILPASGVQYDQFGTPVGVEVGQSVVPDGTYANLNELAVALGYHGVDDLVRDQMQLREQTQRIAQELHDVREDQQTKETVAVFLGAHQEFPNDEKSINVLDQLITSNGLTWSVPNMEMAHSYAIQNHLYEPLTLEEQAAASGWEVPQRRNTPPPMLRSSNPESGWQENDPYKIPLDQLRKQAIRQQLEGTSPR